MQAQPEGTPETAPSQATVLGLTPEQQAIRARGIGASEVPVILGVDMYGRTPFDLWAEKTGKVPPQPETPDMRAGQLLEPVAVEHYRAAHPQASILPGQTLVSERYPWAVATPDRLIVEPAAHRVLEVKNKRGFAVREWGESGTDHVPFAVIVQAHWQMLVTDLSLADVALLIDGREYREYRIVRDETIIEESVRAVEAFVRHHIQGDVAPPLDAGTRAAEYLQRTFPSYADAVAAASLEANDAMSRLALVKQQIKALETEEERLTVLLQAEVADRRGISGPAGSYLWTTTKGTIDWRAAAESVGMTEARAEVFRRASYRKGRFTPAKEGR